MDKALNAAIQTSKLWHATTEAGSNVKRAWEDIVHANKLHGSN